MSDKLKLPTFEEVVGLSNDQLMKCMQKLNDQINQVRASGQITNQFARLYRVYEDEWLKRRGLAAHKVTHKD